MESNMEYLFLIALICVYFIPGLVASSRDNPSAGGVWVINIFLGWTLLGWVVALAWAYASPSQSDRSR
ncbi:superinfection immunity protein [Geopseudomonas aromaticivorans]